MTKYQHLTLSEPAPHLAVITLARPQAANALSVALAKELADVFKQTATKRAIILTGNNKHFCAGADLKERENVDESTWQKQHQSLRAAVLAVYECPAPVIAAVGGSAFGGGLELALACDFIYASDTARFGLTETSLGIMPGLGGSQSLSRAIGPTRAKELIFTAAHFTAEQAYAWGMINRVCQQGALLDEAIATATTIAANAPLAIQAVKKTIREASDMNFLPAWQHDLNLYASLLKTSDRLEGIRAWNNKEKPEFKGE